MANDQIDIEKSHLRTLALFAGAWGFVALCAALLYWRPRGMEPGSLHEFIIYGGVAFFGFCGIVAATRLFRTGVVVSIGREGVFDRRLSTNWIPWDAIRAVGTAGSHGQKMLVLAIDPAREPSLPFTSGARRMAKINAATLGVEGYWISAADLKGGFGALDAAMSIYHPRASTSVIY